MKKYQEMANELMRKGYDAMDAWLIVYVNNSEARTIRQLDNALHFAIKREQRVWGSGEHEKARAEVERLELLIAPYLDEPASTIA